MKLLKVCNKSTQALMIIASVAALVFFFLDFATVKSYFGETVNLTGSQLAWKGDIETLGAAGEKITLTLARSTDIWFCFMLTALGVLFAALTFKFKGMRYAAPAVSLGSGIYMLVIALSKPASFVDINTEVPNAGLLKWNSIQYEAIGVWGVTAALLAAAAFGIAYLLISDRVMVAEGKNAKLTIPKRVVRFFKDYKSEVKKIVWPSAKTVFKNTMIVLVICLILGAFIWALDYGLAQLLKLIF